MFLVKIACSVSLNDEILTGTEFEAESGITLPRDFSPDEYFEVIFVRKLPFLPLPQTTVWAYGNEERGRPRAALIELKNPYEIVTPQQREPYVRFSLLWNDAGKYDSLTSSIKTFREAGWRVFVQEENQIV